LKKENYLNSKVGFNQKHILEKKIRLCLSVFLAWILICQ